MAATLAPLFEFVVCTACSEPRSLSAVELGGRVSSVAGDAVRVRVEDDPEAAVALAGELAGPGGSVVIAGSLYLLADLAGLVGGAGR